MKKPEKKEIIFVNPTDSENEKGCKAEECSCRMRVSDGHGNYSDVYFITLCKKHSAAPDLLEACKNGLVWLIDRKNCSIETLYGLEQNLKQAIAKAEDKGE